MEDKIKNIAKIKKEKQDKYIDEIKELLESEENRNKKHVLSLRLGQYDGDIVKNIRKNLMCQCKFCHYLKGGVSSKDVTRYTCINCDKKKTHLGTNVLLLCADCALELSLCKTCCNEL